MVNITVMVSGGGTNLQAIIDGINEKRIRNAKINLVLSSNPDAYALKRAEKQNINTVVINRDTEADPDKRTKQILAALEEADTDLIVLAGYMQILPLPVVMKYERRIINVHPSLIPKHCGKGFYGRKVHESVISSGDKQSGATVHYVDEGVDTGDIIIQKELDVLEDDTAETLAERVLEIEHLILVSAINRIVNS